MPIHFITAVSPIMWALRAFHDRISGIYWMVCSSEPFQSKTNQFLWYVPPAEQKRWVSWRDHAGYLTLFDPSKKALWLDIRAPDNDREFGRYSIHWRPCTSSLLAQRIWSTSKTPNQILFFLRASDQLDQQWIWSTVNSEAALTVPSGDSGTVLG